MGILLDKKQIWVIFLSSKWVVKKQRQLATSATHLAQETVNEHTVLWWFKNFCKGDESLEDEELSGWPLPIRS